LLRARTTRLTAGTVIGHDHRVLVEHGALKARIRAHVLAHLLAHPASVAVGGKSVEKDPEGLPWSQRQRSAEKRQLADGCEVANKGEPGPQREHDPQQVFETAFAELGWRQRCLVQAQTGRAVAL